MSELSQRMLRDSPLAVHEQFDLLAAAMHLQMQLTNPILNEAFSSKSDKEAYDWLRVHLLMCAENLGGPVSTEFNDDERMGILFLYFDFYESYTTALKFKSETPLNDIQRSIVDLAVPALHKQLERRETANIVDLLCSFIPVTKQHEIFLGKTGPYVGFKGAAQRAKAIAYAKSQLRFVQNKNARNQMVVREIPVVEPKIENDTVDSSDDAQLLIIALIVIGAIVFLIWIFIRR